jgi:hypothetical protein
MKKKEYIRPLIETIDIDKDISLILMSVGEVDPPPPPPFGAAQTNPFEDNAFDKPLK